ncbi:MAG TPA: hypothetical protein VEX18_04585, partial [Polyangiaceae bacterium]|nr:hypothetical protein [Polyangiaceae bacterium]
MPKKESTWRVLQHDPIEQLADNLWRVNGALPGMSLRRNMTVVRRRDGTLVLHSAIALQDSAMRELEALGTPAAIIVPNRAHRLDAPGYKERYPAIRVYTPRGARKYVEEVVPVDGTYEDFPHDEDVRLEMLEGVREGEGAMIVHSSDGVTLVLNDSVMNMDTKRDVLGYLFTTVMGSAPGPRVSRLAKLLWVHDKSALRRDLERFARIPQLVRL